MATSGAVFYDRGEERTTAPCEHGRLHQAMLVALQQRRVHPLKPTLHPMRRVHCPLCVQQAPFIDCVQRLHFRLARKTLLMERALLC